MPRVRLTVVAVAAFVLMTGVALGGEVIHFENGTFLPIRSHTIKDSMVHVVLGSNASMAFPTSMVDRIERGGHLIWDPSTANKAVAGTEDAPSIPGTVRLDAAPASYRAGTSAPATARRSASKRRAAMMATSPEELLRMQMAAQEGPQAPESESVFPGAGSKKQRRVSEVRNLSNPEGRNASPVLEDARQKVRTKPPRITAKPLPAIPDPEPPAPTPEDIDNAQRAAGDSPEDIQPGESSESGS